MKGFLNLGQTCYFNAAVQCLVFAPNCTNYLLEGAETNDVNPKRKLAGALAHEFAQLVREYWSSGAEGDVAHVEPLFVAFCKACKGFKVGEQHDAHEAMVCMLDKIHEGLSRMKPGDLAVSKQAGVSGTAWVSDLKSETSIVSEVFRGQVHIHLAGHHRVFQFDGMRSTLHGPRDHPQLQRVRVWETHDGHHVPHVHVSTPSVVGAPQTVRRQGRESRQICGLSIRAEFGSARAR